MTISIYVINLARSTERRAFMVEACAEAGVAPEFVAAFDGRRCRSGPPALSRAETGLNLSHRKAWRRFLRTDAPFAVVLEDDAHLGAGFKEIVASDWAGLVFDLVKLETMYDRTLVARRGVRVGDRSLHRMRSAHLGAAGYVISRAGAERLLALTRRFNEPIDQPMFGHRAIRNGEVVAYQLIPAVVIQDQLHPQTSARRGVATTLQAPDRVALAEAARSAKPRGLARLRREAARIALQIADAVRAATTCRRTRVPFA